MSGLTMAGRVSLPGERRRRGRVGHALATCAASGLFAAGAWAQEEAAVFDATTLEFFGVSGPLILTVVVAVFFLHSLSVHFGAVAAGLQASFDRAMLVVLATGLASAPLGVIGSKLEVRLSENAAMVGSVVLIAIAQTGIIKWLYHAPLARAVLAYLVAASLTLAVLSVALIVIF